MKKFLVGIISLSLLLSACTPREIRVAKRCQASTVVLHMKIAKGNKRGWGGCSGVYIAPHTILTADHCVDMAKEGQGLELKAIWVKNIYGRSAKATVIKMDAKKDLALLKTDLRGTPVRLARTVKVGEDVWVIGNPLGFQFIISKGVVSRTNLEISDDDEDKRPVEYFVTDAVVLPGNSGGPAFNRHGQLIGIVVMSTSMVGMFGASGLGIVVQIDTVRDFLNNK